MQKFWIIVSIIFIIKQISAQSRCAKEPDGRQLPVPNSLNTYIFCSGGNEQTRSCPIGQEFSPFDLRCFRAIGVNPARPPSGPSTSPRDRCFNQADGTYLPDPSSRNRFIMCSNGDAIIGNCGTNEIFNEQTSSCETSRPPIRPPGSAPIRVPGPTTARAPPARPLMSTTTTRPQPGRPTRPPFNQQPTVRDYQQPPPRPMPIPRFNQRPIVPFK
ncbi:hypothetical protein PVAND_016852 [Polypedilum vanderplanki]|uniref:Chitin-binding type-2 domain-containing protein n=1 Tax=Polypedilum vanderplanki TaxID=319348 RepID=A0A9J6BGW3_POLVA|nr:hypothetical protein PVAND_016852 [Polypedilum vanderplanki]